MRKAAATRLLARLRFLFSTALPPLLGTRGAKVTCETNCFSDYSIWRQPVAALTTD
jgi:hypothetical protein